MKYHHFTAYKKNKKKQDDRMSETGYSESDLFNKPFR